MHGFANPARFLRLARWLTPLLLVTGLVLAFGAMAWGVFVGPADALQGDSVRILYLHVPTAWLGMGGWTAIAIASLVEIVDGSKAVVTMGGGCQGCAVSALTLREGIQKSILEHVPEITEVVDATDHDAGVNPFYTDA